jgi:hypothetical protein
MANKQIHELPEAGALEPEDRLVVSTASGNLTRRASIAGLPFRQALAGAVARPISAKLGELVSVKDFGAVGDGGTDDSAAFQLALERHKAVWVPPGTYRLDSEIQVKPRRRLIGAGRDATIIDARAARAFTFHRNTGTNRVDQTAAEDWNRSVLAHMTVRMTKGGVRVHGHEFRAFDLAFFGGGAPLGQDDPDGWCLDMVDANECTIRDVQAGYGGGGAHRLLANGVRWSSSTPAVNYGDSLVEELSVKLGAADTVAVLLRGNGTGLINNVLLSRVQVNAPVNGSGITALAGTSGIKLWNAARIVCLLCDVEVVDVAFEEYSESTGGTAGACTNNSYVGCFVHYAGTAAYRDSNDRFSRSVIRTSFLGCDNLGPIPIGNVANDNGRAQDGDLFAQGLWVADQYRQPSIQLRSRDKGVLLITTDQKGAAQANADGHPSQANPYYGLLIEQTSQQSAKITRPVANGAVDSGDGTTPLLDVRLELGNGENDARGELARVQVNDPLYLRPRTTQPMRPIDGLLWYATSATGVPATGEYWLGEGIYGRVNNGDAVPVAVQRGAVPERERNLAVNVSAVDFGKIHRINNAGEITVTVPAGLVSAGQGARRFWVIRQGTGGVRFAASGGAILRSSGGRVTITKQFQMVEVVVTSANDVYLLGIYPDADLNPSYARRHRERNTSYTVTATHLGELHRCNHGANAITVTVPYGLWPADTGEEVVELEVSRVGNAQVFIRADAGTTGTAPMQMRLSATTVGVTTYNRGDGQLHFQYELAPWETRKILIRKIDATTGEVFLAGLR